MTTLEQAARLALLALDAALDESVASNHVSCRAILTAQIDALRAALAQQAEPVAILPAPTACATCGEGPYFTAQQMREYAAALGQAEWVPNGLVRRVARVMSDHYAAVCEINADDLWNFHSEDFVTDARAALEAARNFKEAT